MSRLKTKRSLSQLLQKQRPKFIKPMLPGYSNKLCIPQAFLKHLWEERFDRALLKSLLGKSWLVKVHKDDKNMWFEEGWSDFTLDHCIQVGEFLLFRYDGGMVFHVTIFDRSACEKALSMGKAKHNKIAKQSFVKVENDLVAENKVSQLALKRGSENHKRQREENCNSSKKAGVESLTFYKATVRPSNIQTKYGYMNIPCAFCRAYEIDKLDRMTLIDPEGRSWPVKIYHRHDRGVHYFGIGWVEFSVMNNLQIGDECIFNFTNSQVEVAKVQIMRQQLIKDRSHA